MLKTVSWLLRRLIIMQKNMVFSPSFTLDRVDKRNVIFVMSYSPWFSRRNGKSGDVCKQYIRVAFLIKWVACFLPALLHNVNVEAVRCNIILQSLTRFTGASVYQWKLQRIKTQGFLSRVGNKPALCPLPRRIITRTSPCLNIWIEIWTGGIP